jgi:glycerate 2-kinase
MAAAAVRILDGRVRGGLVVCHVSGDVPPPFEVIHGGHPIPSPGSERAGRRALELAASVPSDESLLVLLSGGASAMMAVPAEAITLEDKCRTTDRLLLAGADIDALNTVRKHISAIKGGLLAARGSSPCRTFAISDVVGDDLSVIASGPTVPDPTTFSDALGVLRRFGGLDAYPASVVARLSSGCDRALPETPKPHDPRLARAFSTVIGGRRDAMSGAIREAEARGYQIVRIDDPVVGEARTSSVEHLRAAIARAAGAGRPTCVVSSGETTVHVRGAGRGGRNQEFALAAAEPLGLLGTPAILASIGTDGVDGPTDAAGAFADSTTAERARAAGIDTPAHYLADNNAYAFFGALGDLIRTGPTDTNVGDIQVMLVA